MVNPYSAHISEATQFLECAARVDIDPLLYYAVHPDMEEPYEDPNFERIAAKFTEKRDMYQDAVEQAKKAGTDDDELQSELDYCNEWLDTQDEQKWLISADTIAAYRQMVSDSQLNLQADSPYTGGDGTSASALFGDACARYVGGETTLDGLLKELSEKMKMIYLENN